MKRKKWIKVLSLLFSVMLLCVDIIWCTGYNSNYIQLKTWWATSGISNNVIVLTHDNSTAQFICSTSNGSLWWKYNNEYRKEIVLPHDATFRWDPYQDDIDLQNINKIYIDIILKIDSLVRGYALVLIEYNEQKYWWDAKIIACKEFIIPVTLIQAKLYIARTKTLTLKF